LPVDELLPNVLDVAAEWGSFEFEVSGMPLALVLLLLPPLLLLLILVALLLKNDKVDLPLVGNEEDFSVEG
jgi:hypothetical protein